MRRHWRELGQRFAGLKRRERGILLVGGVIVVFLVGFSLIDSSFSRQRVLAGDIDQLRADTAITKQQSEVIGIQLAEDLDVQARARIAELTKKTRDIEKQMRKSGGGLVPPERMAEFLQKILEPNKGVQLVGLKTLPVSPVRGGKQGDQVANVYKHGVEISLQGRYRDLLKSLERLEKLPWQMLWSEARMDARAYPAVRITVTVFTLSLDEDWLLV